MPGTAKGAVGQDIPVAITHTGMADYVSTAAEAVDAAGGDGMAAGDEAARSPADTDERRRAQAVPPADALENTRTATAGVTPHHSTPRAAETGTSVFSRRRTRWRLLAMAVVLTLGVATGGLSAWAPWRHQPTPVPPVLRPSGLAAGNSSFTSVSLRWSGPSHGLVPSKYEIFQNGSIVGSVSGATTSYDVTGLVPNTAVSVRRRGVRILKI